MFQTCAQSSLLSPWLRQPVRARYVNWHMRKDALRREMVVEYAPLRLRVNAVRKNTIIPLQIRVRMPHETLYSVPAGSGKRAGCERNRAQSGARTTEIRAQFSLQTTKNRAQFRARTAESDTLSRMDDQNSGTIQHASETRSWHNFAGNRQKHGHKSASSLQFI